MSDLHAVLPPHDPIWPGVVLSLGLSLSASWTIFLGYELIKLVKYVI
jgi:hypothetical protein